MLRPKAITLMLWLVMHGAWAQSIEPARHDLVVGQAPLLRMHVRGFEINPAQVQPACIHVLLSQGGANIPDDSIEISTRPLADDGKVLVQISSSVQVVEPVLHARIALTCGADFAREFSLLADPPSGARDAGPAPASARARHVPPQPKTTISERQVPAKGSIGRSSPEPRRQPEQPAAGARLQLEEPTIGRVVEAVLSALAQRPADAQRNTPATRDVGMRPIEADWLRELQALQEEQRQARAQVAALQLRLERQESDTLQRWGAIVATAIGLVAAALLLRLARERVLPRLAGVLGRGEEPESLPAARPRPGLVSETAPPGTAHAQLTRGESPAGLAGRFEGTARPSPPGHWPDGSLPRTAAPHEDTTMPRQWAHADFGEPSLDGVAHAPWLQQVDQMSASGHHGVSVTLLESALQVHRGKNPWVLTRLLDLYRAMDQPWNHERVSAQIEALYNVRVPPMHPGEPDRRDEGRSLEDDTSLLGRIVDTWPRPEATIELLGTCLLRDRGQPATDIAEFRDLLLLYAIARQLTQPGDELAAT